MHPCQIAARGAMPPRALRYCGAAVGVRHLVPRVHAHTPCQDRRCPHQFPIGPYPEYGDTFVRSQTFHPHSATLAAPYRTPIHSTVRGSRAQAPTTVGHREWKHGPNHRERGKGEMGCRDCALSSLPETSVLARCSQSLQTIHISPVSWPCNLRATKSTSSLCYSHAKMDIAHYLLLTNSRIIARTIGH
jgi:hypothetical protein